MSDNEQPYRCPGCGEVWDDLPDGHDVAFPMDGGKAVCSDPARPVSPEEFMAGLEGGTDQ